MKIQPHIDAARTPTTTQANATASRSETKPAAFSAEAPLDPVVQQFFARSPRAAAATAGQLKGFEAHRMMTQAEFEQSLAAMRAESTANAAGTPAPELLRAMHGAPSLDTAIEYLLQLFSPAASDAVRDAPDQEELVGKARDVIANHGDAGVAAFVDRVLFNVDHPPDYSYLAPLVIALVPPATLADTMVASIERGSSFHVRNASALAYFVLGADGVALSSQQRTALQTAQMKRQRDQSLNSVAAESLQQMLIPF